MDTSFLAAVDRARVLAARWRLNARALNWSGVVLCLGIVVACGSHSILQSGAQAKEGPRVLVLGDSIGAASGVRRENGWVMHLERKLKRQFRGIRFANRSKSGDTTAGGLARLPALLDELRPDIVLLELGGNDGLRSVPVEEIRNNLDAMARLAMDSGSHVLITGMMMPLSFDETYRQEFHNSFHEAAASSGAALLPFLLETIVQGGNYFQEDNVHPNTAAQVLIADHVQPALTSVIEDWEQGR